MYESYASGFSNVSTATHMVSLDRRRPYLEQLIRRHFPPDRGAKVIDFGCGHGALVKTARRAGYVNIVGVDHSAAQIAAARRLGIEGVREGDARTTACELPDASHDVVVTFDLIEHFTKQEVLAFADQVVRILRPAGRWIVHVPNGEALFGARVRYGDFTHEGAYTRHSLGQLASVVGFSSIRCFEDVPVAHGVRSAVRWVLWKGIRATLRFYLAVETGAGGSKSILSQNLLAVMVK
jgi:2-polyprenyl-3-methyl-5-hydroxy-6-metoxy-1,4-benzoquinol methylase